jgi:hypothetical protein
MSYWDWLPVELRTRISKSALLKELKECTTQLLEVEGEDYEGMFLPVKMVSKTKIRVTLPCLGRIEKHWTRAKQTILHYNLEELETWCRGVRIASLCGVRVQIVEGRMCIYMDWGMGPDVPPVLLSAPRAKPSEPKKLPPPKPQRQKHRQMFPKNVLRCRR